MGCCPEPTDPPKNIPVVSSELSARDVLGDWGVRWKINRNNYRVNPGLYALGQPDADSPVLVTANYRLTFNKLRSVLPGQNLWLLVLNTRGVNVWCAAGKGTFGTEELVRQITAVGLSQVVKHRQVIVPQLGAPGVAAHHVLRETGFRVVYGPVRAADIPRFLAGGLQATPEMRQVNFGFLDRLVLTPVELVSSFRLMGWFLVTLIILEAIRPVSPTVIQVLTLAWSAFLPVLGAVVAGTVLVPLLLPWIPGRAFAWKGWIIGVFWALISGLVLKLPPSEGAWLVPAAYFLSLPALTGYLGYNFTGSTTYTSLSGVEKELKLVIPLLGGTFVLGVILLIVNVVLRFIH